nr:hypothetical protein [Tanacetum cinerariifolium]
MWLPHHWRLSNRKLPRGGGWRLMIGVRAVRGSEKQYEVQKDAVRGSEKRQYEVLCRWRLGEWEDDTSSCTVAAAEIQYDVLWQQYEVQKSSTRFRKMQYEV